MAKKIVIKTNPKSIYQIIFLVLVVLVAGYFSISFFIADALTAATPNPTDDSPNFVASNVSNITFPAADGIKLHGWFYQNTNANANKRIIIQVVGIGQNRSNDGYYGLFISHDLYEHGYSILLYDPRESGNPPTRNDLGQTRGNDVLGAVQFAKEKGYAPQNIGIIADSLGTVAILMVVDKLNDIGPIVIDSGIARMQPEAKLLMSREHGVPSFFFPGTFLMARIFYHLDLTNINPIDHVKKVPNRVFLFLIGTNDTIVQVKDSTELQQAANPASKLIKFQGASHIETYRSNPTLYLQSVYTFFKQQFPH